MLVAARIGKRYGRTVALDALSLTVDPGELVSLLGPSGCGKTTFLRIVAGFVRPSAGTLLIAGRDATSLAPERRNLGMVFQSYSLWPHMTVFENVAFGLRTRGRSRQAINERVRRCLTLVRLEALAERLPAQLSGGQQQRVALARAIAYEPDILLLDEPFSALDRRLREDMQREVRALQRTLGITALFVTHDQEEAMLLSDRVAVMANGGIEQVGTPREIYTAPANRSVADFVGRINAFEGVLLRERSGARFVCDDGPTLIVDTRRAEGRAYAVLRPERIAVHPLVEGDAGLPGTVTSHAFLGAVQQITIRLDAGGILLATMTGESPPPGSRVRARWSADAVLVLPA